MDTSSGSGKYALLNQIAEEFAERRRRGEVPSLREYVEKYPHLADDLRDILPAMAEIEQVKADAAAAPPSPPAPALRQVGDYRILREVGRGGMGVVYEAVQESLGRRVALKVLPAHTLKDEKALERFRREARAAAKLHHTNIVPVFEVGQDGGACFYAMQFIQGQALDQIIDELRRLREHSRTATVPALGEAARSLLTGVYKAQGLTEGYVPAEEKAPNDSAVRSGETPLSGAGSGHPHYFRSVAGVGQQVAQALSYAHARQIIHRDIKPSNLLLDAAGVVWVTDFGLAKTDDDGLTNTGDIVGTLRYMAPERFEGRGDARADVYALGLTLYELLTLQPGFSARDRLKLVEQMRTQEPPRPRSLDRRIPRDLETIVLKAMDRDAARRYQTAEELAQDLGRFLDDEPIHARQASVWERGWRWARRRPAVAGLFAALTVAAVALIAVAVTLYYNQKLDTLYQAAEKARGEAELARKDALQARDNEIRLRGLLAVRTGQFQDAIDDLSKLLPTDDRDVYVGLGQAYAGAGQPRQAVEHFSVALARDPEDVEARVGRAREYAKQRRHKEAADDYAAAFRIEPNLTEHAADYARALYEDAAWSDLEVIEMKSAGGATLTRSADNSILASGKNPAADVYTVAARTRLPHVAALRLELMARPNGRGAGRHLTRDTNGGWVMLGAFDLSAGPAPEGSALQPAPFEFAWSHFATSDQGNILNTISDERTTGWQWGSWLSASPTVSQSALFFLRQPLAHPRGTRLTVRLDFPTSDNQGQLAPDCFRLSATSRTDLMAFESMIARPQIDPWTKLAAAHCLRGDGAAALRALAKSAPKDANGFNALLTAVAQCQCEQWKEGRETLLRAFPQTLQMSDVQALLAVALSRLLQREPDDIELRLERARCYRRMGCWRPALADYERAQEIDPKDALILLEGGECRLRLGDAERAAADFEAAHRINPDACYAFHVTRAPTVKDVSGRDLACGLVHLKALCQAARGADTERGLLMRLAQLTERVTHYDDALAAYERLLELNPQDAKVLLLAAYVYRKRAETSALMGKHEEARQDWRRQQKFLEERLALHPDSATYAADLAQGLLAQTPRWTPVRPLEATAARDTPLTLLPDGSVLADSKASGDVYTLVADVDWKGVRGVKLEFLGHPRLSHGGPGRGWDGAFAPPDVELKIPRSSGHPSTAVLLSREPLVTGSLSGRWWEWAVYQTPPFADDAKGRTTILIHSAARQNPADIIGRCRLAVTADPQTVVSEQLQQSRLDGWLKLAAAHVLRGDRDAALAALRKGPAEQQPLNDVALAWVHLRIGKSDEARGAVIRVITLAKDWGDAKKRTGGDSPFDDPLIRALADGVFEKARAAGPDDKELLSLLREAEAAINGPKK